MAAKEVGVGGSILLILLLMHLLLNIDSRINWIDTKGSGSHSPLFCYVPLLLVVGSKSVHVILSNPTSKKPLPQTGKNPWTFSSHFFKYEPPSVSDCTWLHFLFCFVKKKKVVLSPSTVFSDKMCFLFPFVDRGE